MKQSWINFFICLGIFLFAQNESQAFDYEMNLVKYMAAAGGGGLFLQALEIKKDIKIIPDDELNYFVRLMNPEDSKGLPLKPVTTPVSWNLGLGYTVSYSSTKVSDRTFSVAFGFIWHISSALESSLKMGIDSSADESYAGGVAALRFQYTIPLSKEGKDSKSRLKDRKNTSQDAVKYYEEEYSRREQELEKIRKQFLEPGENQKLIFPSLKVGYQLGFGRHQLDSKILRQGTSYNSQISSLLLNQMIHGLQISYLKSAHWNMQLEGNYYTYSNTRVDDFLNGIETSFSNRLPIMYTESGSYVDFTNQYLTLPSFTLLEKIHLNLGKKAQVSFILNQTWYASLNSGFSFGFNPIYYFEIFNRWGATLSLNSIFSAKIPFLMSGSLGVSYSL